MPVTPTGFLSLKVHEMRTLLSNSGDFQTWTGTANAAAALARIHTPLAVATTATLPFAVVDLGTAFNMSNISERQFDFDGDIFLVFREAISQADGLDAYYAFTNTIGAILEDLTDSAKGPGNFPLDSIQLLELYRSDWFEEKISVKYYEAIFSARYGL